MDFWWISFRSFSSLHRILWVPELSHADILGFGPGWQVGKYLPDEMPSLPGKSKRPEAKFVGDYQRDPNEKHKGNPEILVFR